MNVRVPKPQAERTLIGAAGEHYVMAQLLRRGYVAALAPGGMDEYDILIVDPPVQIQVKSRTRSGDGGWTMTPKHESLTRPDLWYAFVDFEPTVPETFVVPALTVATVIRRSHEEYLNAPGRDGQPRKDNRMRRLRRTYQVPVSEAPDGWLEAYRDRWDRISAATA